MESAAKAFLCQHKINIYYYFSLTGANRHFNLYTDSLLDNPEPKKWQKECKKNILKLGLTQAPMVGNSLPPLLFHLSTAFLTELGKRPTTLDPSPLTALGWLEPTLST